MAGDLEGTGAHFEPVGERDEPNVSPKGGPAANVGPEAQNEPWWRGALEFVTAFAVMAGVLFLLRTFVIEPFEIPSGSMLTTIEIGDRVFAEKISVAMDHMPAPGEIVTFVNPRDPSETLIKRAIAVEGQTIDLRDGYVYIDGVKLDEPYVNGQATKPMRCDGKVQQHDISYPFTIPEGCFWAMGDNRGNSSDSRVFGPVGADTVTGHAVLRYWPIFRTQDGADAIDVLGFTLRPIRFTVGPLD